MTALNCQDRPYYTSNLSCRDSGTVTSLSNLNDSEKSQRRESFLSLTLRLEEERSYINSRLNNASISNKQSRDVAGDGDGCHTARVQPPISKRRSSIKSNKSLVGNTLDNNTQEYGGNICSDNEYFSLNGQRYQSDHLEGDTEELPVPGCSALQNIPWRFGHFFLPDTETEAKIRRQTLKLARSQIRKARAVVSKEIDSMRQYFGIQTQIKYGRNKKLARSASGIDSGGDRARNDGHLTRQQEVTTKMTGICSSWTEKKYAAQPSCNISNMCTSSTGRSVPSVDDVAQSDSLFSRSSLDLPTSKHDPDYSLHKHSFGGRSSNWRSHWSSSSIRGSNDRSRKQKIPRALHDTTISGPLRVGKKIRSKSSPALSVCSSTHRSAPRSGDVELNHETASNNPRCSQRESAGACGTELRTLARQLDTLGHAADSLAPAEMKSFTSTVFSSFERLLRVHGLDTAGSGPASNSR